MAATIVTTYRVNGSNRFVAQIQISGDAAGDVTNQTVMNSVTDFPGAPVNWKIDTIDWEFTGFTGVLTWDGTAPALACALPQYDGEMEFKENGASITNKDATTPTGKLMLSTSGLAANRWGTIMIRGRHK